MLNSHPLQAVFEALALEVATSKVAECLRLLGSDGRIYCPVCTRDLAGKEIPSLLVSGKIFKCSNPKCSAAGNVVDLVTLATGLPRPDAVGIVMKIKADQPVDLPEHPDERTRDTSSFDSDPEVPERDTNGRAARDEDRADQTDGLPEHENINATIWNAQAKDAVIAPNDIFQVYIHQVGLRPLLDKGEESLFGREVREHRESYIRLMLELDPILLQVATMLKDVVEKRCSPSLVLAPSPSVNGDQHVTKRPVRATINAIRKYEDLKNEVNSKAFCRQSSPYRSATLMRLGTLRKKCVTSIIAVELRKSVLWNLYNKSLLLLEAACVRNETANGSVDDDPTSMPCGHNHYAPQSTASDLLKALRFHFSEHVRSIQDLACSNLRLAIQTAIKYRRSGLPIEDLIQSANLGLLAACERFDERRGARFSTYATWWIRQAIQREIEYFSTVIRLPSYLRSSLRDLQEFESNEYQRIGHHLTVDELAQQTDLEIDVARKLLRIGAGVAFFSELEKAEYKALRDGNPDTRIASPLREAIYSDLKQAIAEVLKQKLHYRMRLVLRLRFGLDDGIEFTLEEVAEILKVTRERVRQIQKRALERLDVPELRYLAEVPLEVSEPVEPEQPPKKRKYAKRKTAKRKTTKRKTTKRNKKR